MAIQTLDQYIAANKQLIPIVRTASRTAVANIPFSVFDLAGLPGAGTLAGTSTTSGVVPTDATAGCPSIYNNTGSYYLTRVDFSSSIPCRIHIFDLLFKAGAYAFNANTALSSQPSFVSRLPNSSYIGLEMWVETVTAFTGNPSFTITYTNQNGTAGRSTGTVASGAAMTVGRMLRLPLQSGDSGVQLIENVQCTVATAGTFNILILRKLWQGRVGSNNVQDIHGIDKTGMPIIYPDSALFQIIQPDSTSTGAPDMLLEISSA